VAADDGDRGLQRVCAGDAAEEARRADDVESGNAVESARVEGAGFGENG
jgi:hypothetical protein